MAKQDRMSGGIPANQLTSEVRQAIGNLADENALLRASLSEMRSRLFELEEISDSDGLTALPNRRRFLLELERAVAEVNRYGVPAAVLYIVLDCLQPLNDQYGHFAGDLALANVASHLRRLVRSTDLVARIGGNEFALILSHLDHNSAIETAYRIEQCVERDPMDLDGVAVMLGISTGTAAILPSDTVDDVLQRAHGNICAARAEGQPRSFR